VSLEQLAEYIDWTFFFTAWELRGKFPAILQHPEHGQAARELFDNGKRLLDRIMKDRSLTARGVYGFGRLRALAMTSSSSATMLATPSFCASRCCASRR